MVGGTASSGLLICLLRMATKAGGGTGQDSLRRTTALYFACSAAITLAGVLAYWLVMPKLSCLNVKRRKLHQPGAWGHWPLRKLTAPHTQSQIQLHVFPDKCLNV